MVFANNLLKKTEWYLNTIVFLSLKWNTHKFELNPKVKFKVWLEPTGSVDSVVAEDQYALWILFDAYWWAEQMMIAGITPNIFYKKS